MIDLSKKRYRLRIIIPVFSAFNIYSRIANKTTALGPVCVASSANKLEKWDIEVIDENNLGKYGPRSLAGGADHQLLQELRPADVVGFYGGLTSTIPRVYKIAQFYKSLNVTTIAGGQHFVNENIKEGLHSNLDYIVLGEGEETIRELLTAFEKKRDLDQIKGLAYLRNKEVVYTPPRELITDFDKFPQPDFSLVRYAKIKIYPVERIRGCGMDCEFCTVKGKPRYASPERLLESISLIVETKGARTFFIVDDLFGQRRTETIRFCHMLIDYQDKIGKRLDLTVQIRLDKANDRELLDVMYRTGVRTVAIGYESPIGEELKIMKKKINYKEMISLTRVFSKVGFLVHGMFIFGYPLKEDITLKMSLEERVKCYKDFIKKAKIDTVQILLPVPLPGTELTQRLKNQNRIYSTKDIGWEYYDGNFPLFKPDGSFTPEELQDGIKKIMGRFYQFKYMFLVGVNIFSFPALVFFLYNIKLGWNKWYRSWRNDIIRFGGWVVLYKWTSLFKKGDFSQKLNLAKKRLAENNEKE